MVVDPVLPGVGAALDVDRMLASLNHALEAAGEDWEVAGGRIGDVQYRPGSSCLVLYRVTFRDRRSGRRTRRFVSAEVLASDAEPPPLPPELAARYEAYRRRLVRTPVAYLRDEHTLVYQFPVDSSLPWLFDAVDSRVAKRQLGRALPERGVHVDRVALRMLGYTPRARATILYDARVKHAGASIPGRRALVGKTHSRKPPDRLFANAWALERAANGVRLAGPVGYSAPLRMTVQEEVRGRRLADFAGSPPFVPLVRETARAIATLHALSFPLKRRRGPEDEARIVNRWADVVAAICPDLAARVERLRERLISRLDECAVPSGVVHGDFHPGNVLTDGREVTLIDLDEVTVSAPLLDAGRFLASLRVSAMRVFGDPRGLADAEEGFLDEYLRRAPGDESSARLFEAASLLIAAAAPFRLQREGWQRAAAMLVGEAEVALEQAEGATRTGVALPERPRVPRRERLGWVTDGIYMQALLDPYVREACGADVTRCEVRGVHETEHGYVVGYRASGWRGDEKWSARLTGMILHGGSGRRLGKDLAALRAELEGDPRAPAVPRPIAYLSQFSLLVVERARGERLASLLGTPRALVAAGDVGRALLALREARPAIEASRSLEDDLAVLRSAVGKLQSAARDEHARSRSLLAAAESRCRTAARAARSARSPVLAGLDPAHIRLTDDGVAIDEVHEIALGNPLVNAGDLLASLTLTGMKKRREAAAEETAARLRSEYGKGSGATERELAGFEAAALLRLACDAATEGSARVASRLLDAAAARLGAA